MKTRKKSATLGRPPKFAEARRPVTVTLPERTLQQLAAVDLDRARAIVKVTDALRGSNAESHPLVDLVEVLPGKALLVVSASRSLQQIEWLRLVEIGPGRNLLVLPTGMPVESLEIAIMDLLENLDPGEHQERDLLEQLRARFSTLRRQKRLSKSEIIFFNTDPSGKE